MGYWGLMIRNTRYERDYSLNIRYRFFGSNFKNTPIFLSFFELSLLPTLHQNSFCQYQRVVVFIPCLKCDLAFIAIFSGFNSMKLVRLMNEQYHCSVFSQFEASPSSSARSILPWICWTHPNFLSWSYLLGYLIILSRAPLFFEMIFTILNLLFCLV